MNQSSSRRVLESVGVLLLLAAAMALPSGSARASYYTRCKMAVRLDALASPTGADTKHGAVWKLQVLEFYEGGGHSSRHCKSFVGKTLERSVFTNNESLAPRPGELFEIEYSYYDSLTPNGVQVSELWAARARINRAYIDALFIDLKKDFQGGRQCGAKPGEKVDPIQRGDPLSELRAAGVDVRRHETENHPVCQACHCPAYSYTLRIRIEKRGESKALGLGFVPDQKR